jgi:hypothetical protein
MGTTKVSLLTIVHHLRRQCNIRDSIGLASRGSEGKIKEGGGGSITKIHRRETNNNRRQERRKVTRLVNRKGEPRTGGSRKIS